MYIYIDIILNADKITYMKEIKPPIRFPFVIDKFITCMAMFASQEFKDFDKLKAAKLLYFADKYHLIRYGKPIIGDYYICMDCGPVPSKALDVIRDACENRPIFHDTGVSNRDKFNEYITTKTTLRRYHSFVLKKGKEVNLDCLSRTEIEAVEETIKRYGKYSPEALLELSHQDASWKETGRNQDIDYRLFFKDPEAKQEAFEYMEALNEDYEIMFSIGL